MRSLLWFVRLADDPGEISGVPCHDWHRDHTGHLVGMPLVRALDDRRYLSRSSVHGGTDLHLILDVALPTVDRPDRAANVAACDDPILHEAADESAHPLCVIAGHDHF